MRRWADHAGPRQRFAISLPQGRNDA